MSGVLDASADGFEEWRRKADLACRSATGVSIDDLADWGWRDAFESGQSPAEAVREAIAEEFGQATADSFDERGL